MNSSRHSRASLINLYTFFFTFEPCWIFSNCLEIALPHLIELICYDKEYENEDAPDRGCLYYGDVKFYLNHRECNSIGFRMLTGQDIEGLEKIYFLKSYKIYKFKK